MPQRTVMTRDKRSTHFSLGFVTIAILHSSFLTGCQHPDLDPGLGEEDEGVGGQPTGPWPGGVGGQPTGPWPGGVGGQATEPWPGGAGGSPPDAGVGGSPAGGSPSFCDGSGAFRQSYVCAGAVYEERAVSQRSVRLYPVLAPYACNTSGTDLTPFAELGGVGGSPVGPDDGVGGSPVGPGDGVGGSPVGPGDGVGGSPVGPGDGVGGSPVGPGGGDGGSAAGGWSGDGDGDDVWGAGGGFAGSPTSEGWCSEAPEGVAISGVTYSLDDCGNGEVKLPLVFQEPQNWYRLRVFHGDSACERGELVADTSGFGTGEIVELDLGLLTGGFVSLEFTADVEDYYDYFWDYEGGYYYGPYNYGDALHVELVPVGTNPGGW